MQATGHQIWHVQSGRVWSLTKWNIVTNALRRRSRPTFVFVLVANFFCLGCIYKCYLCGVTFICSDCACKNEEEEEDNWRCDCCSDKSHALVE
eukprot:2095352-Ditylum_brightwellii.AAC.1